MTPTKQYRIHKDKEYKDIASITDPVQKKIFETMFDTSKRKMTLDEFLKSRLTEIRWSFYVKCLKQLDILHNNPILEDIHKLGPGTLTLKTENYTHSMSFLL